MTDGTDQRRELNHLMLGLLEEWRGHWVRCVSGASVLGVVGRVRAVHREAGSFVLDRVTGGVAVVPVGVYLGIELLGPEQQQALERQLVENVWGAGRMVQ